MPTVSISDIRANPVALRNVDRESETYIQLRDSVADPKIGLLNPIGVRERQEDVDGDVVTFYEIIDGLHRFTACCDAGYDEIEVSVKDFDETEAQLAQIIGNAMRVETKPIQYTKHLQRIIGANPTWTMNDLATKLHKSPTWLNQRFGLLKLDETIQSFVDEGKIAVSNAVVLAKLPHEEQLNFVDQAITLTTGEFAPAVQTRLKELKNAEREGRSPKGTGFPGATPRLRKISELKEELASREFLTATVFNMDAVTAAYTALEWVMSLDAATVEVARAKFEERAQRTEEERAKRKAERAEKKAQEAATAAAQAKEAAEVSINS